MNLITNHKTSITNHGFTLIELLVVISIIGILTTLLAANLNSARSRARDAQRKSDMRSIGTALRLYYNDWGTYPPNTCGSGGICGCSSTSGVQPTDLCEWGDPWVGGDTTYMQKLTKDPLPNQVYFYKRNPLESDKYTVSACLENKSDSSGVAGTISNSSCTGGWVFVVQP
jgi:type II secretion system protein G